MLRSRKCWFICNLSLTHNRRADPSLLTLEEKWERTNAQAQLGPSPATKAPKMNIRRIDPNAPHIELTAALSPTAKAPSPQPSSALSPSKYATAPDLDTASPMNISPPNMSLTETTEGQSYPSVTQPIAMDLDTSIIRSKVPATLPDYPVETPFRPVKKCLICQLLFSGEFSCQDLDRISIFQFLLSTFQVVRDAKSPARTPRPTGGSTLSPIFRTQEPKIPVESQSQSSFLEQLWNWFNQQTAPTPATPAKLHTQ